ncbi:hypothetical protein [Streptacidiphilus sp. MAP5-3]|uniref:SU10 major capsid protein n=1 Tax=unclassified Streptacidiphilus TaxID=2643834 RepID=UPI003511E165
MATELKEALTASGASALIPKVIDPQVLDYQRRYSPLVQATPTKQINTTTYYFNQLTNRVAGGFVTDGGARPVSNSTYVQNQYQIRQLQAVGGVTGYAQKVTQDVIGDLLAQEIQNTIQGQYWDIETALLWGNSGATANDPWPQFDGLDTLVNIYSGVNQNVIAGAGANLSLSLINQMIDLAETNAAMSVFSTNWMIIGSNTAFSMLAELFTNQQRFMGSTEVAAGLNVPTYRDIPLVKTSFLSTHGVQVGTVTTTPAATGGTLATGTYYYRVAAVIARSGETIASAEVSATTTANTSTVTLAFTTPTGQDGASPISYKVYRGSAAGGETLLGYVDAIVGTGNDGITPVYATSIVDTGSALVPQNGATVPGVLPTAYNGTNAGAKPRNAGIEDLYLVPRDANFMVRPYVREIQPIEVAPTVLSPDTLPFAMATDTCLAVRAPRYVTKLANVAISL